MRLAILAITALLLAGCREDPATTAARVYLAQLEPLLEENSVLANELLLTAAGLYNEEFPPAQVPERWTKDIAPLAEHLHQQAALTKPLEPWNEPHAALVETWGARADAYDKLADALARADAEQWQAARKVSDEVKLKEEAWFRDTNERLRPLELSVDQFP